MPVNRYQLMNELGVKLTNDAKIADDVAAVGDNVVFHWQGLADLYLDAGYATGEYKHSIHRVSERGRHPKGSKNAAGKSIGGQFVWHTRVLTHNDHAHLIEYGTRPDHPPSGPPNYPKPPKAGGHWTDTEGELHFWWNTPTRPYALAAQTEMDFTE